MNEEKMSFLDHLGELRKRLLWSFLAILVFFIPAYAFSNEIFDFLMKPLIENLPEGSSLIFTRPTEGFTTYLKVSFFASVLLAIPFILYQAWKFVAPALYKKEKQIIIPFIFFGSLFFLLGAAFCYYVASPPAFKFLLNEYSSEYVKAFPTISEALSFFMALIFGFGLVFEFPLIIFILARIGVVTSKWLREKRKYAIILSALIAAILTPTTDAISMMLMFVPIVVFYELGILVAWMFGKKKKEEEEKENTEDETFN
ncbi:MAG: twin-arginine translocase subunit TatC [Candidatus Dadabacteria bacterium]|jgi:sec-independent protein translocase protein TatC|nr:twin-arginine translocase subunit TatC [Candidatus Dadabacteria bacterium]MCZ6528159.1 twin-arginine translocase subunit TatC [Candidatus Dadabacteria bacterium]TDI89074.1 MAG: twin-arginine translocase subunit TatC [Candidatus Dadabacteria bacterium]